MKIIQFLKWLIKIISNYIDNKNNSCKINYDLNVNDRRKNKDQNDFQYTSPSTIGRITNSFEIPDIKSKAKIDTNKPTILLMDDYSGIISILLDDFKYLGSNVIEDLNILYADGTLAAFSVKKFLDEYKRKKEEEIELELDSDNSGIGSHDNLNLNYLNEINIEDKNGHIYQICQLENIDIALLDITIGGFNYINNEMVEYDGIDIAKFIKELFPECKIYFLTGHKPNRKNPKIFRYMEKFRSIFHEEINTWIIPKNSNRTDYIIKDLNKLLKIPLIPNDETSLSPTSSLGVV